MCNSSSVWSDLVKLAYRGFAGFFVFLFMFTFGMIGLILSFAGALITVLSWIPLAYPEILDAVTTLDADGMVGFSVDTADPVLASLALLLAGLILLGVGVFFLACTYGIGKGALIVDKEVASIVDKAFSSDKDRLTRLERLAALRDRGVLTDDEFEYEKELLVKTYYQSTPTEEPTKVQFVRRT